MNVKIDGLTLHIEPDENLPDPRTDFDHLGTMLCWHRHYNFGDKNGYEMPEDFLQSKEAENIYVSLPVYLLDHSGLYLSTSGFADVDPQRWDWGQLGVIYCTEAQAKEWYGYLPDKETLKAQLNSEVECYNDYLNGSWYAFYIESRNGEIEDACGGFFQNEGFTELIGSMKEYVDTDLHPLFDKLVEKYENHACM